MTKKYMRNRNKESVGVATKTMENKNTKEAVRSNDWFRAIWKSTPVFIHMLDKTGRIIETNPAVIRQSGYTKEELVGKRLDELFTDSSKKLFETGFPVLLQRGTNRQEVEFVCKDMTIMTMDCVASAIRDERGKIKAIFAFQRDITERKRADESLKQTHDELERRVQERTAELLKANEQLKRTIDECRRTEEALRISEARFRAIVEDQTELICRFLPDGTITFVNEAYCRYFGKKPEELIGHTFMPLIPDEDHPKVEGHLASLNTENIVGTNEHRVIASNGETCWQQWTNRLILDRQGRKVELQSVGRDITERKIMEKELCEREKKLEYHAQRLNKVNTALKVLLEQREEEKKELEENILTNVRKSIFPYIEKMENNMLSRDDMTVCLRIIKSKLEDLVSPFLNTLSSKYLALTPTEIQIADLVKMGKTSKEIASLLNVSDNAICFHRNNIRKKLGLTKKKVNLRSYLQSLYR